MTNSDRPWVGRIVYTFTTPDCILLIAVVGIAAIARVTFFTGFFGSDEVTYVEAAISAASGYPLTSTYIGSVRLGINLPIAASIEFFGRSVYSAAAWGFACSLGEVIAVFWIGRRLFGREHAVVASLAIALLPLHVHLAGRIMADPPVALFITLTFLLLFEAGDRRSRVLYLLSGVSAGIVYWIKESTLIFLVAPAIWMVCARCRMRDILWTAGGLAAAIGANFIAMWSLSGNPFHLIDSLRAAVTKYENPLRVAGIDRSPLFYLAYLFLRPWHTWILGYLSAIGVFVAFVRFRAQTDVRNSWTFVLVWSLGPLAIFSLFVLSLSPFQFIPKQTNYLTVFFAPLCILAAVAVVELRSRLARLIVIVAYVFGAVILCALEQLAVQTFTTNSAPTLSYAAKYAESTVYVVTNAERLNYWAKLLPTAQLSHAANLRPLSDLRSHPPSATEPASTVAPVVGDVVAIVDLQTLDWGDNGFRAAAEIPSCWERRGVVQHSQGRSAANVIADWLLQITRWIPGAIGIRLRTKMESLASPLPALIYHVPAICE